MHANNETGVAPADRGELPRRARARGALVAHRRRAVGRQGPASTCDSSASTCSRSPATSSTRPRASARSTSGAARRWRRSSSAPATSAGCGPAPRTSPPSSGSASPAQRARRDLAVESGAAARAARSLLWERLRAAVPGLALNGHAEERLPNTLNVRFPGRLRQRAARRRRPGRRLDRLGLPRRTGERAGGRPRDGRPARSGARRGAAEPRPRNHGRRRRSSRARAGCGLASRGTSLESLARRALPLRKRVRAP